MRDGEVLAAKELVWSMWGPSVVDCTPLPSLAEQPIDPDLDLHGPAPIGRCRSRDEAEERFAGPLHRAMPVARRDLQLFLGGRWRTEAGEPEIWVAATGHLVGELVEPFCGIRPVVADGGGPVRLRFGDFHRVAGGRIVEQRILLDLPGLAAQTGVHLLPPFPVSGEPPPPPALGNGVVRGPSDPVETAATLQLVEDMLAGCNRLEGSDLASMGMAAHWHDDMVWHGPWGVGSCRGFDEFQDHAQGPSVQSFPDRRGGHHRIRFADGLTAAFTGWPSLRGTFDGEPFRGIEPTGGEIGQNIMDFYVRRDDKLHENWVLIDLVDFAAQCGVDLLAPLDQPQENQIR
ncbi:MAG: ester cyclase [Actinomycetota bacterium]